MGSNQLDEIHKMLKWLVIQRINDDVWMMKSHPLRDARNKPIPIKEEYRNSPDISDIIKSGK